MPRTSAFIHQVHVADGFADDCEELLHRCSRVKTLCYGTFSEIWKDMNFGGVFCGRKSSPELAELSEECLIIAKHYMIHDTGNFEENVAGLFLVYGLLNLQPFPRFAALRLTPQDVPALVYMEERARQERRLDVLYVLGSVLVRGPVQCHVAERERGMETAYRKYIEMNHTSITKAGVRPKGVLFRHNEEMDVIRELKHISKRYCELKSRIDKTKKDRSLQYVNTNLSVEIETTMKKLINGLVDYNRDPNGQDEPSAKDIKDRAMTGVVGPVKSLTSLVNNEQKPPKAKRNRGKFKNTPKRKRKRKPSPKKTKKSSPKAKKSKKNSETSESEESLRMSSDSAEADSDNDFSKTIFEKSQANKKYKLDALPDLDCDEKPNITQDINVEIPPELDEGQPLDITIGTVPIYYRTDDGNLVEIEVIDSETLGDIVKTKLEIDNDSTTDSVKKSSMFSPTSNANAEFKSDENSNEKDNESTSIDDTNQLKISERKKYSTIALSTAPPNNVIDGNSIYNTQPAIIKGKIRRAKQIKPNLDCIDSFMVLKNEKITYTSLKNSKRQNREVLKETKDVTHLNAIDDKIDKKFTLGKDDDFTKNITEKHIKKTPGQTKISNNESKKSDEAILGSDNTSDKSSYNKTPKCVSKNSPIGKLNTSPEKLNYRNIDIISPAPETERVVNDYEFSREGSQSPEAPFYGFPSPQKHDTESTLALDNNRKIPVFPRDTKFKYNTPSTSESRESSSVSKTKSNLKSKSDYDHSVDAIYLSTRNIGVSLEKSDINEVTKSTPTNTSVIESPRNRVRTESERSDSNSRTLDKTTKEKVSQLVSQTKPALEASEKPIKTYKNVKKSRNTVSPLASPDRNTNIISSPRLTRQSHNKNQSDTDSISSPEKGRTRNNECSPLSTSSVSTSLCESPRGSRSGTNNPSSPQRRGQIKNKPENNSVNLDNESENSDISPVRRGRSTHSLNSPMDKQKTLRGRPNQTDSTSTIDTISLNKLSNALPRRILVKEKRDQVRARIKHRFKRMGMLTVANFKDDN